MENKTVRKKRNPLYRACNEVEGFSEMIYRFKRNVSIASKSRNTYLNYSMYIGRIALYFNKLPLDLTLEEVKEYLFQMQSQHPTPSLTCFKHTVFGLRLLLKLEGLPYSFLQLPKIPKVVKLPYVLSKQEVWQLLQAAPTLKLRVIIGLLYGCGLRCMELRNIRLTHLHFERKLLHISQSKGKKDRYVPLSNHLILGIREYIRVAQPIRYLFNGAPNKQNKWRTNLPMGKRTIQAHVTFVAKRTNIQKHITTHVLRHCFATHLLEDGANILTVKQLLGHTSLNSTIIYLSICSIDPVKSKSPLDTLFEAYSTTSRDVLN